jgi:hypothetical protein
LNDSQFHNNRDPDNNSLTETMLTILRLMFDAISRFQNSCVHEVEAAPKSGADLRGFDGVESDSVDSDSSDNVWAVKCSADVKSPNHLSQHKT